MPLLELAKLDWPSLSTLIAGALAVGAAVLVGFRQLTITRQQTSIAERQTRLAELTLRYQLFDRRMTVYNSTAEFLAAIVRDGTYPSRELEAAFLSALGTSRFLFPSETHTGISEISDKAMAFRLSSLKAKGSTAVGDQAEAESGEAQADALKWFFDRLKSLPDLFGDELRLS